MEMTLLRKAVWFVIVVIVAGVAILAWSTFHATYVADMTHVIDETPTPMSPAISTRHSFKDGIHEFEGEVVVDRNCEIVMPRVSFGEEDDVILVFETKRPPLDDFDCALVPTLQSYQITFAASKEVSVRAILNGKPAMLVETKPVLE